MSPADVPPVSWAQALGDGPGLDVVGAWLAPAPGLTLWPVAWREALDGGLDELGPASTARPWVLVEAAEVRRPRRRPSLISGLALLVTAVLTGPKSPETNRVLQHHLNEQGGGYDAT